MIYAQPGTEGSIVSFQERYGNYINGEWIAPVKGVYFTNTTPVTGEAFCEIPRSTEEDINLALDAAHARQGDPAAARRTAAPTAERVAPLNL